MKKLLSLVLVLTFVFGGTAIAAEKFNLSGQYRMEMYNIVDSDWNSSIDDDRSYIDQRFRLQFDFTPAENVKAVLRGDFAESNWGTVTSSSTATCTAFPCTATTTTTSGIGYRATANDSSTIMIDKAYVDLTTAMINWQVGLFPHAGFGKGLTTDNQGANIMVTADFAPVAVTALWTKADEGTALTDDAVLTKTDEDQDIYGIQVAFKSDAFGAGVFYALNDDKNGTGANDAFSQNVIGLYGDANFGMISVWAELDMFGGDDDLGTTDYVGRTVTVQVAAALSDQLKLTADMMWSAGTDTAGEVTITDLTEDSAYLPFDFCFNNAVGEFGQFGEGQGEAFETNAGAKSIAVKADFKISDAFSVRGGVGYSKPDVEDPNADNSYIESMTVFGVNGAYTFLPGATFQLAYETISRSVNGTVLGDDSISKYMGMLSVNF